MHNKAKETAQKASVSALVVIDYVFHKIIITQKGFLTEKKHWKFILYITMLKDTGQTQSSQWNVHFL